MCLRCQGECQGAPLPLHGRRDPKHETARRRSGDETTVRFEYTARPSSICSQLALCHQIILSRRSRVESTQLGHPPSSRCRYEPTHDSLQSIPPSVRASRVFALCCRPSPALSAPHSTTPRRTQQHSRAAEPGTLHGSAAPWAETSRTHPGRGTIQVDFNRGRGSPHGRAADKGRWDVTKFRRRVCERWQGQGADTLSSSIAQVRRRAPLTSD